MFILQYSLCTHSHTPRGVPKVRLSMIYATPGRQSLASAEEPEGEEAKHQEKSKCFIRHLDYELDCTRNTLDDSKHIKRNRLSSAECLHLFYPLITIFAFTSSPLQNRLKHVEQILAFIKEESLAVSYFYLILFKG